MNNISFIEGKIDIKINDEDYSQELVGNKLAYLLLKKGIIDTNTVNKAIFLKQKYSQDGKGRKNLAQILVQDLNFDHDLIFREVASFYAFRTVDIDIKNLSESFITDIRNLLDTYDIELKKLLLHVKMLPLMFDINNKNKLIIGAIDPTDKEILRIIQRLNVERYEITYLPPAVYEKLIEILIPPENEYLINLEKLGNQYEAPITGSEGSVDESLLEIEINKSALINLFEGALIEGVRKGASDIHFLPESSTDTLINFRVDGKLLLWHRQQNTMPEAIIAVVKDRARGLDRFERESGQDGFIQREIDGHIIRFRVSIIPIAGNEIKNKFESIVIRILDDRKVIKDLGALGFAGYALTSFQKSISNPQGLIILTGPTGCGKSTTLQAALHQVINPSVNVITVEDPIEYIIKGARQVKLGHKLDFEHALRYILRHDPDIVLVGEMRDKETADIAIKLANTGHLTFSTLHTNDAPSAISRLYKMGIEPFLLANAINIIVAQRLIRKLCECKKKSGKHDEKYFKRLGLDPVEWKKYTLYEPVGCEKCLGSGFKGRMAVHEAVYITKEIAQIILDAGDKIDEISVRKAARKDGSLTLREAGLERVKNGITSLEEVFASTMDD
ncbi:MAG TPA: pilus assembly protein PilB [Ignavibacteriales bacterium]|nr:pilus assembly protein PilB [Ignavibacteriales bacterium]